MPATPEAFLTAARAIVAQREAEPAALRGTNLHGWATGPVDEPETVEQIAARLHEHAAKAKAFRASPRGRYLTAVEELRDCGGYECEAYDLEGLYRRSFADVREPLNVGAVGAALAILDRDGLSQLTNARAARRALEELLIEAGAGMKWAAE